MPKRFDAVNDDMDVKTVWISRNLTIPDPFVRIY